VIAHAFHPEAEAEFTAAAIFYETRIAGLGARFVDAVEAAVAYICEYPDVGTPVDRSGRRVRVRGFPYAVVYERQQDGISILAVAHLRQRPGYWRDRS
jgi:plasmid stabilization system protein ParE